MALAPLYNFESRRHPFWNHVSDAQWSSWKWQLQNKLTSVEQIQDILNFDPTFKIDLEEIKKTEIDFNFGITPYYFSLMSSDNPQCPIRMQAIPSSQENVKEPFEFMDFPKEEQMMPVPGLTHRYPDRAMLYTTHHCAVYCRFCTRKRKVSHPDSALQKQQIFNALAYIEKTPAIREVILSGGDIFSFSDSQLDEIISRARAIEHVEIIRLGTRNLVTLPFRVTDELLAVLKKYPPLYIHTHFNHPNECSAEALLACKKLRSAGCVVNNHTVILKGINDHPDTITQLNETLLRMGVQPYYMYHCDLTYGSHHFRTKISDDLNLVRTLQQKTKWASDISIPHYMVDTPGGGKIELI